MTRSPEILRRRIAKVFTGLEYGTVKKQTKKTTGVGDRASGVLIGELGVLQPIGQTVFLIFHYLIFLFSFLHQWCPWRAALWQAH